MSGEIAVLLVDEDRDVVEVSSTFLERADERLAVTAEVDPANALDRFVAGSFDAVVSDYRMPEMDGLALFEAIRDRDEEIPYFLLTAAVEPETTRAAEEAGVTGLVAKDVGTEHYDELATDILAAVED